MQKGFFNGELLYVYAYACTNSCKSKNNLWTYLTVCIYTYKHMCFPMLYIFIFMFANDLKIWLFCKVNININPQISVKCELWVNTEIKPLSLGFADTLMVSSWTWYSKMNSRMEWRQTKLLILQEQIRTKISGCCLKTLCSGFMRYHSYMFFDFSYLNVAQECL